MSRHEEEMNDQLKIVGGVMPMVGPYTKAEDCPWHPGKPLQERDREAGVCGECRKAGRTPTYSPTDMPTKVGAKLAAMTDAIEKELARR
jgi:hypothetical protein